MVHIVKSIRRWFQWHALKKSLAENELVGLEG
jgi:hypothetical protein